MFPLVRQLVGSFIAVCADMRLRPVQRDVVMVAGELEGGLYLVDKVNDVLGSPFASDDVVGICAIVVDVDVGVVRFDQQ